jgi:hypothetical protein|nr:MAG TPA_asm: hypothetical protein [Caudoviricetes sp.]
MIEGIIAKEGVFSGKVCFDQSLLGKINPENLLAGRISADDVLSGKMAMPVGYKEYLDEYRVTPKVSSQTLPTSDKHLSQDVVVDPIPYYEVSNQNGKTIIIGGT